MVYVRRLYSRLTYAKRWVISGFSIYVNFWMHDQNYQRNFFFLLALIPIFTRNVSQFCINCSFEQHSTDMIELNLFILNQFKMLSVKFNSKSCSILVYAIAVWKTCWGYIIMQLFWAISQQWFLTLLLWPYVNSLSLTCTKKLPLSTASYILNVQMSHHSQQSGS